MSKEPTPDDIELAKLTARVKMGALLYSVPGFQDALLAYLAGTGIDPARKLAKAILGRDPIYTDDVRYEDGRIFQIGSNRVSGYTPQGYPAKIGGRRVEYGIFGIPVRVEGIFSDLPGGPEPSFQSRMSR